MNNNYPYSEHLDTIVALVSYLGTTDGMTRTPNHLAEKLSLNYDEMVFVLTNFKGLFRESKSKNSDEKVYDLHLRYGLGWLENKKQDDERFLDAKYLEVLLGFISNMVAHEEAEKRQISANRTATIGAWIAAVAASIAALIEIISITFHR